MIVITRKVPKKKESHSHYGDRNSIVITTESGEVIQIYLFDRQSNEARIGIDCPKSVTIMRKEKLTNKTGKEE